MWPTERFFSPNRINLRVLIWLGRARAVRAARQPAEESTLFRPSEQAVLRGQAVLRALKLVSKALPDVAVVHGGEVLACISNISRLR